MNTANYKIVRINSDTRIRGTPTDFTCQFINHDVQTITHFTVGSVSFVNLFDNVDGRVNSDGDVTNTFTFFSTLQGGNLSVVVPIKQYTNTQLATSLTTLMTAAMSALAGPPTVAVTVDDDHFRFVTTGDTIGLLAASPMSALTGTLVDSAVAADVTASEKYALQGEQLVYIHSRTLGFSNTLLGNDLMVSSFVEIPITVPYGSIQGYQMEQNNGAIMYSRETKQSTIHIKVRSPDGHLLTLPDNQRVIITLKAWY